MLDRYDPRDAGRDSVRYRSEGSRGANESQDSWDRDNSDTLTRNLDLPRGREREEVRDGNRVYEIDGNENRILATAGVFRVVYESDLQDPRDDFNNPRRSVRHLESEGLFGQARSAPTTAPSS